MTPSPDDQIDPYEPRLARRVGEFAEQAVRPFDAAAVAAAAHAGARHRTVASRVFGSNASVARLGVLLAGTLIALVAVGLFINAGRDAVLGPDASIGGPMATPSGVPGAIANCGASDLEGGITTWEGAAGHRLASVTIRNTGAADCTLPQSLRPALVDVDGHVLIAAHAVAEPAGMTFPAGATATTMVDMANYCGAPPTGDLLIRFYLPSDVSFDASDKTRQRAPLDPPPCNGPNAAASIQMQPVVMK